jgi:hypothetical protein
VRIALDLDGVLADLAAAFMDVAARLYPAMPVERPPAGEVHCERERPPGLSAEQIDRVWREIRTTPDFWMLLRPIDASALPRLQDLAARRRWEVVFLTCRPDTPGQTVQCQTQRWLAAQGFALPSVVTVTMSRGQVASALALDVVVDDSLANCMDVRSDSQATPLWIATREIAHMQARAKAVGIGVARSIGECLDLLEQLDQPSSHPRPLIERLRSRLGLKRPADWRTELAHRAAQRG